LYSEDRKRGNHQNSGKWYQDNRKAWRKEATGNNSKQFQIPSPAAWEAEGKRKMQA
jgi:hypothetical protein